MLVRITNHFPLSFLWPKLDKYHQVKRETNMIITFFYFFWPYMECFSSKVETYTFYSYLLIIRVWSFLDKQLTTTRGLIPCFHSFFYLYFIYLPYNSLTNGTVNESNMPILIMGLGLTCNRFGGGTIDINFSRHQFSVDPRYC